MSQFNDAALLPFCANLVIDPLDNNNNIKWINIIFFRMFGMVLEKLFLADLLKVSGGVERKIVACGVVKLLCDCPAMYTGAYQKYWSSLLQVRI